MFWNKKRSEEKQASESRLKINMPGVAVDSGVNRCAETALKPKSLDEMHAETSRKCVCRYCETLNEQDTARCIACGKSLG